VSNLSVSLLLANALGVAVPPVGFGMRLGYEAGDFALSSSIFLAFIVGAIRNGAAWCAYYGEIISAFLKIASDAYEL
jgi:hypothetical protein